MEFKALNLKYIYIYIYIEGSASCHQFILSTNPLNFTRIIDELRKGKIFCFVF
jgi:hypothetical protein